jgi:hypothetical protein
MKAKHWGITLVVCGALLGVIFAGVFMKPSHLVGLFGIIFGYAGGYLGFQVYKRLLRIVA